MGSISAARFTFLGTGTSAGVPSIGCACTVCRSEDPRDRRLRTSAVLEFVDPTGQARAILIDAGPDLREQALRHKLTRLDAILFTHNHVDHTWGLDEVRRFNVLQQGPIDVYANEQTDAHLRRVYMHIYERDRNVNDSFVATLIPHRVEAGRAFELFGVRVTPLALLHGKLPILGYRFDVAYGGAGSGDGRRADGGDDGDDGGDGGVLPLAYCTDVSAIPPETWGELRGLGTLVLDALRDRKHPTHLTLDQAIGIAEKVDARRTRFVHMSHDLGHAETMARLKEAGLAARMELAHDGMALESQ